MQHTVYLAGPITGLTAAQQVGWRNELKLRYSNNFDFIDPMDYEAQIAEHAAEGRWRAVAETERRNILHSDAVLAYVPQWSRGMAIFARCANCSVVCVYVNSDAGRHFSRISRRSAVSDRKYRQHGYQDRDPRSESKPQQSPRPSGDMTYGPRAIQMAPTRTISRCAQCGVVLPATVDPNGKCPKCAAALHACKQCMQFDSGSRFECRLNVPGYPKKDLHNDCSKFTLSERVERETSSGANSVEDARRAFDNLFKK